jgi:lysozyme
MAVNQATLELIREFEGLRTSAYPDPAHGWRVPTIGIGHTSAAGPPEVYMGLTITEEEAYDILSRDLAGVEDQVRKLVRVPLNENQFGALVSFTFNLGAGNLQRSTLLKKLNKGNYEGAAAEFGKWVYAGGEKLNGLVRRREAERLLFLKAVKEAPNPAPAHSQPKPKKAAPKSALAILIAAIGAAIYAFAKSQGWIP